MTFQRILPNILRASVLAAAAVAYGANAAESASPATAAAPGLEQDVKISESQARLRANLRVAQGSIKMSRLEMRDGRPVWHFDIMGYDDRSREDVYVDATTGDVTSTARDLTGPSEPAPAAAMK